MSFSFIQESKEDSIATVVLAFAIASKFWVIDQDSSILPFVLLMAVLALILTKFFNFIAEITFGFLDYRHHFSGIASFRYAYDHINFMKYRQKVMANIRLIAAIIIILLPPGPLWSFLGLNQDFSWIKRPFFLAWYGDVSLIVLVILLSIVLFLTYFQLKNGYKRLKIVRVTNALVDWRGEIQTNIRENQWETVFVQMEEARNASYEIINEFKEYLRGIEYEAKKNTFMTFYIGNMDYFKHQSIFSEDKGALLLQQIENYRQLQYIHPIEFGYITDDDENLTSADIAGHLELLPLTQILGNVWSIIDSIKVNYEKLTKFELKSDTDYQDVIKEVNNEIKQIDQQIDGIIKEFNFENSNTQILSTEIEQKNVKNRGFMHRAIVTQLQTNNFLRKLVILHLSGFHPEFIVFNEKFDQLKESITQKAKTNETYQSFLDKHQDLVKKVMKSHEFYHNTVNNFIDLIIKEVEKLETEIGGLF